MKKSFLNSIARTGFVLMFSFTLAGPVYGISAGQIDDFQDGTLMGWDGGSTAGGTLTNITGGGPLGAGDKYLEFKRDSYPFHIAVKNEAQWTGNYLTAGVTAIGVDLNHLAGDTPLTMRLMLWGDGGVWASTNTTPVTATPGWNSYVFGLGPADLVHVSGGTGLLYQTLSTVSNVQLRHDYSTPTPPGAHPPHITGTLGIDNIIAIPEPATLLLVSLGALLSRKRK